MEEQQPPRRRLGTQLGRRRNKAAVEQNWAEQAEREAGKLPEGHGQIVRGEAADGPTVATVTPPQKHVDGEGKEVVPYRQINSADPAAPVQHGAGQTLPAATAPTHQVGAPPPRQGAHHPIGHSDPRATPQSQPQQPVYRIKASTSDPAGAQAVEAQHGFQSMQQQHSGGVQKMGGNQAVQVGGQPVQSVAGRSHVGMPASVQAVPGIVSPDQARQFMQQPGQAPPQAQFQARAPGGPGAQPQGQPQGQPSGPPAGVAEVLQESSEAVIGLADDATMLAELEAAGMTSRLKLKTQVTTIQRRVTPEELVPAERLDVTVFLTCNARSHLLRTQLDSLRRATKIPAQVVVLVVGEGPHPADVLSDGRPWSSGPLIQNTVGFGATPWTRFSLAMGTTTKYVCFLDDDCIPGDGWLTECVRVSDLGLNAVIAAAGNRLSPDGSVSSYRGPWHADDGVAVSDFSDGHDGAALVDVGALGWFFPTQWLPSVAQVGPMGHPPYGWQVHVSASLQFDGGVASVVLPYALDDRSTWGATQPPERDGLSALEGMGSLRDEFFAAYRETEDDNEPGWVLVAEMPEETPLSLPVPEDPVPAPAARVEGPAAAPTPEELPPGVYFNTKMRRHLAPGDPEWSAEHYELVTGQEWTGADRVGAEEVTKPPQVATKEDAPGTLGRAPEGAAAAAAKGLKVVGDPPKVAGLKPAVVEVEPDKLAWCACGQSKNQPFCDGSHEGTRHEPVPLGAELLKLREGETKKKVVLCMCKGTQTPPFCDGSHVKIEAAQATEAAEDGSAE